MRKIKTPTEWNLDNAFGFRTEKEIQKRKAETQESQKRFVLKWRSRHDYLEDPEVLKEALDDYEELNRKDGSDGGVGFYYSMKSTVSESDPKIRALYNATSDWSTRLQNDIQFFELSITQIPSDQQRIFINAPILLPYQHFLERLFAFGAHTLSDSEERIMNFKSLTSYEQWTKMTSALLSKEEAMVLDSSGKKKKKSFEEIRSLISNPSRRVRDAANAAYLAILERWIAVGEAEINAVLEDKRVNDELRGYTTPDAVRHLHDDIDTEIIQALIAAVEEKVSISHEYFRLKAKLLGVKKLRYHDRLVDTGSVAKNYSFQDAYTIVFEVFKRLDEQFAGIFEKTFQEARVDVFPKKGKRGGAFCAHNLKEHPTFILLNHAGKLRDVVTLAHEFGHAINNTLVQTHQNSLHAHTPTSTAEVASTFMEDFVFEELEKTLKAKDRLGLLMNKLSEDILSVFYCIAMYKFEMELHMTYRAKRYLSASEVGSIYRKHMQWWVGPAVTMEPGTENIWLCIPHVRYFFYMYSYASGNLISKALQSKVRSDHSKIALVKEFLSAGSSDSPKKIFKALGIDITKKSFWERGLLEIENTLKEVRKIING